MRRQTQIKRCTAMLLVILLFGSVCTACTAKPEKYPQYADLTFDAACLDLLGKPPMEAAQLLEELGEWEYLYDDAGNPNPRPNLAKPVTIAGEEYTVYARFDPVSIWAYAYERRIESTDDAEKNAAVQAVFDVLYEELGEPEELTGVRSLREGLETGLTRNTSGSYTEWWVLDEHITIEAESDLTYYLTCRPLVEYRQDSVVISVTYALYNREAVSDMQEIKRYAEA